MTKREFFAELEHLTQAVEGSIQGNEPLNHLPGWDSLAIITLIAIVDEKLGVPLTDAQIRSCRTTGDLVALFPGKIVG